MTKAIVVLSGGQDSTTCAYWALKQGFELSAVTFDYGQRHKIEIEAAQRIAESIGVQHEIIHINDVLIGSSPLVNPNSQLEQYKDHQSLPGGLEKTFVPMRNLLFLTIAANRALAIGANSLVTGVCQEDFGGYPDCRATFIASVEETIAEGASLDPGYEFLIHTPLMNLTKAQSVELAMNIPGCYEALGWTHTSYDGAYPPTGHDHATLLRAKGFEEAGVPDPLVLRAYWDGFMPLPVTDNYMAYSDVIQELRYHSDTYSGRMYNLRGAVQKWV